MNRSQSHMYIQCNFERVADVSAELRHSIIILSCHEQVFHHNFIKLDHSYPAGQEAFLQFLCLARKERKDHIRGIVRLWNHDILIKGCQRGAAMARHPSFYRDCYCTWNNWIHFGCKRKTVYKARNRVSSSY